VINPWVEVNKITQLSKTKVNSTTAKISTRGEKME
jgi:hypothetical protein